MSDQAKTEMSSEESCRGATSYPLRKWWQSSRLSNQDHGLPPFLEPRAARWMDADWLQRSLAACYWPGFVPAPPLFVPHVIGSSHHQSQKITTWRVSMDVAHFSPSEISLSTRDDFLEVKGKHEERPDEHGFIARCFTRKYRLPVEVDSSRITASLYIDGILTVEAPLHDNSAPTATAIPIKVEIEGAAEQQVKKEDEGSCHADVQSPKDHGEEAPSGVCPDQAQYGNATTGMEQEEQEEQEEETHGEPAEEAHQETLGTSEEADHKEAVEDEEIQVLAGSGEASGEITLPEEQELGDGPQSEDQGQDQGQDQEPEADGPEQGHNE